VVELPTLDIGGLEFNDAPKLVWWRVRDAVNFLWKENPKRHDIGAVIQSIERYGFQEPAKFDVNLPNTAGGQGAIKAGNGRVEAAAAMERDGRYDWPRGTARDTDGAWCIPMLMGTDAYSEEMAAAYGIDANNLTLSGGDLTAFDYMRMYDADYTEMLGRLAQADELPVSVGLETLDTLKFLSDATFTSEEIPDLEGWEEPEKAWRVIIQCETEEQVIGTLEFLGVEYSPQKVRYNYAETKLVDEILRES